MKKLLVLVLMILSVSLSFAQTKVDEDLVRRTEEWFKNNPGSMPHWMTPEELERVKDIGKDFVATSPPSGPVRQTAEFERMQGVLIRYTFGIPVDFIKQLSEVTDVYTICLSTEKKTVENIYIAAGIDTSKCEFVLESSDSYWTRDYGPWYVVNGNNEVGICDFMYNRPRPNDDAVPSEVAVFLSEPYYGMSVVHTGGNYMTDGMGVGASTTIVYEESFSTLGISSATVDQRMNDYLGIHTYHVVDDPNNTYIDHIDCWGKFLDVDKILIRSVPTSHAQYDEIEATVDYFEAQTSSYGAPYEIYRVYTPNDEPYSNSLILNDHVFVPVMGGSNDAAALSVYQNAMPGYTVVGVPNSTGTPWESTDALHCRTRGIIDKEMLHIYHVATVNDQDPGTAYTISTDIVSYGGHSITSADLNYRINGGGWNAVPMVQKKGTYTAEIPAQSSGTEIEYYIHAADNSGRSEFHPFIGQADPHKFNVADKPDIAISQTDTLNIAAAPLSSGLATFSIMNSGSADLNYSMNVEYTNKNKGSGGPDSFGYSWKDSDEPDGPVYSWIDITGSGTALGLTDDGISSAINLGFTFNFYGTDYSTVRIGGNGALTFTGTSVGYSNPTIPTATAPNAVVSPFWDDLNPGSSTSDDIYYYQDTANGRFIVQYNEIINYGGSSKNTFEVILNQDGTILFQYNSMNGTLNSCTVGIENGDGSDGVQTAFNQSYIKNSLAVEFKAVIMPEWLILDPVSGTISASGSSLISATANSEGLDYGVYYADIIISSNDTDENPLTVPVKLTISDALNAPGNLTTSLIGSDIVIDWDDSSGATSYDVYSADDPYGAFTFEANVVVSQYTVAYTEAKKFYYVVAKN